MATIKLKKPALPSARGPLRGGGVQPRPTLAQAQALRAERETRYQEQLRQRYGDQPPPRRASIAAPSGAPRQTRSGDAENSAFAPRPTPRSPRAEAPARAWQEARPPQRGDARPLPRGDARPPRRDDPRTAPRHEARPATRPAPRQTPFEAPRDAPRRAPRAHRDEDFEREPAEHAPGSMRLSKRMSELGLASRREADEWIAKGWVRVDDQVVSELGSRVVPEQRITVDAKARFQQAQRVTVLINKPVGYVSGQAEDGYEPAVVLVTPANQWPEDRSGTRFLREHLKCLVPAGRLDIDSVGLLVLTQDGRIAKQLIGEDSEIEKEYLVRVAGSGATPRQSLGVDGLATLCHGLELDGEALRPARVEWLNEDQLRFVLTQGKKRQIRRMCEAVGLQVLGLKRVRVGRVMLGDLPAGQWRYLRADEAFA